MAARSSLRAVALASDEGLLLAASRSEYDSDGLAAISVARDRCMPMTSEAVDAILCGEQLRSRSINIHGEQLYLAWLGERTPSVEETATALLRILGPILAPVPAPVLAPPPPPRKRGSNGLLSH
jgi:hypothetical protein